MDSSNNNNKPLTGAALELWIKAMQASANKNRKFLEIIYTSRIWK